MNQKEHIKAYPGPAAGWGALKAVTKSWLGSENAFRNLRAMLKTNQNGGFDCPGCAWGESPESGMVNFCENGAKAVNWESTSSLGSGFLCQIQRFGTGETNRLLAGISGPPESSDAL